MRTVLGSLAIFVLTTSSIYAQDLPDGAEPTPEGTAAIVQRLTDYIDTFNSGDAEKFGSYWSANAVCLDEETGERTAGREAIEASYQALFADSSAARLSGSVDLVRCVRPDVAIAKGTVTLLRGSADPVTSAFTAVLIQEEGQWLIESSYERALASSSAEAPPLKAPLQELDWLVGEWRDESEGVEVYSSVRWTSSNAFLIRSFHADFGQGGAVEGTQIIGWDPGAQQYRTWTFNSDGSFGEGEITRLGDQAVVEQHDGERWSIRISHVLSDGRVSTGTQLIERLDANTMRIERVGQTIDGLPAPAGEPVTVVRYASSVVPPISGGSLP